MEQKIDYAFTTDGLELAKAIQKQVDKYKTNGYFLYQTATVVWRGCFYAILTFNKK